jgi:spermidine synthase
MRKENLQPEAAPYEVGAGLLAYLVLTSVVCGGLIMMLEVLGSRVIGPFFGVSLFVWTSLITVTLVALSLGYAAGGFLSDRRPEPRYLYLIIFAAGVLVLLIPVIKAPVLKLCQPMGLRSGAFLSSAILFGPALLLLGCVSPYVVKIAVKGLFTLGRTVGVFYAVSTAGSFVGTVLTGFVLIAFFGVNAIFAVIGSTLVLLALFYFLVFERRGTLALFCLAVVPLVLLYPGPMQPKVMANGTAVSVVHTEDTFYGSLKVVDYWFGPARTRELLIDGMVQGGVSLVDGLSIYEYAYFLEFLPYLLNPEGKTCLVVGLGAGTVPVWYERMGVRCSVVDIDPEVVAIARRFFGFSVSGEVHVEDARYFLSKDRSSYDYVVLDVFNGDTTPAHLLSSEALGLVKQRMAERSVLAVNIIGNLRNDTFVPASVKKTLEKHFAHVELHPLFDPFVDDGGMGNMIFLAYDFPFKPVDASTALQRFPVHPLAREVVSRFIRKSFDFPAGTRAMVITDDYNPVDFFDLAQKERLRKDILRNTDFDVLL